MNVVACDLALSRLGKGKGRRREGEGKERKVGLMTLMAVSVSLQCVIFLARGSCKNTWQEQIGIKTMVLTARPCYIHHPKSMLQVVCDLCLTFFFFLF